MSTLSTVEVLRGAKAVIERNGWHQGDYADRRPEFRGKPPRECPVCLLGAINVASGGDPDDDSEVTEAERLLKQCMKQYVPTWNDAPGRTVAEVYALLDEAIERAEAGEVR